VRDFCATSLIHVSWVLRVQSWFNMKSPHFQIVCVANGGLARLIEVLGNFLIERSIPGGHYYAKLQRKNESEIALAIASSLADQDQVDFADIYVLEIKKGQAEQAAERRMDAAWAKQHMVNRIQSSTSQSIKKIGEDPK